MARKTVGAAGGDILEGSIPMKGADGRKYKVRVPSTHDFTSDPTIEGILVAKGVHEVDGAKRYFVVIDSGKLLSRVYESKAMEDLFKSGEIGDHVKLTYTGEKDLGGGRSFKKIAVEVWSE